MTTSNKDLTASIKAINPDAVTDDLNNAALSELLTSLTPPVVPSSVPDEAPAEAPAAVVAEGKSVTSKRGIIDQGKPVEPGDFAGGQKSFDALVGSGFITVT